MRSSFTVNKQSLINRGIAMACYRVGSDVTREWQCVKVDKKKGVYNEMIFSKRLSFL